MTQKDILVYIGDPTSSKPYFNCIDAMFYLGDYYKDIMKPRLKMWKKQMNIYYKRRIIELNNLKNKLEEE